jgi:hypothetical protein
MNQEPERTPDGSIIPVESGTFYDDLARDLGIEGGAELAVRTSWTMRTIEMIDRLLPTGRYTIIPTLTTLTLSCRACAEAGHDDTVYFFTTSRDEVPTSAKAAMTALLRHQLEQH